MGAGRLTIPRGRGDEGRETGQGPGGKLGSPPPPAPAAPHPVRPRGRRHWGVFTQKEEKGIWGDVGVGIYEL